MTIDQILTLLVLAAVVAALIWDKVRADVVALTGAAVLLMAGVVRPVEVQSAFARYEAAQAAITTFEQGAIPRSSQNVRTIRAAYQIGAFSITDLLVEQRRLLAPAPIREHVDDERGR